jgi:hypothetical protein
MTTKAVETNGSLVGRRFGKDGGMYLNEERKLVTEMPVWRVLEGIRTLRAFGVIADEPTDLERAFPSL